MYVVQRREEEDVLVEEEGVVEERKRRRIFPLLEMELKSSVVSTVLYCTVVLYVCSTVRTLN